jgi:hypothetical protein
MDTEIDLAKDFLTLMREGRFQRSLALIAGASSLVTGLEVGYEHYKGSYSQTVMWSPIVLSGALAAACGVGFASEGGARWVMRPVAAITMADGLLGFYFHVRGVARKPGGWSLPVTNIVMGPPLFAPLLFVLPGYLGFISSYLRREGSTEKAPDPVGWRANLKQGRFQKHLAAATAVGSILCGLEAWYSHYKSGFSSKPQWIPVVVGPVLAGVSLWAMRNRKVARTLLPAISAVAGLTGLIGTYYHVIYGPPIFAPMLFGACGMTGIMAALMGREE